MLLFHCRRPIRSFHWILLFPAFLLVGCQAVTATPASSQPAVTPVSTKEPTAEQQAWQSSPHANTYDLGKGPNTYCARCHSPENWSPTAKIDSPPNCVSCKFATDAKVRIAQGNPLVPAEQWKSIGCEVCHPVQNGVVSAQVGYLDTQTGYHETVTTSTVLCEKCHTDTQTLRHKRDLGTAAHAAFTCTKCHDPHSTAAGCTNSACHTQTLAAGNTTPGHDTAHKNVSCVACHDASGLEVGPQDSGGMWTTFRTTELLGRKTTGAYQSHAVQLTVDCKRCHYSDNPWKLSTQ